MDLIETQKQFIGAKVKSTTIKWSPHYKGFGLRLNPSGKHKWISYSSVKGKKIYKTIGEIELPYKAALNAFLATKHDKSLIEIVEQQNTNAVSPTIKEFAEIFKDRHIKKEWSDEKDANYIINAIVENLGNIRIGALRVEDVEILRSSSEKESVVNHRLKMLSTMWNRAAAWGFVKLPNGTIPSNPCKFVKKYKLEPRGTTLSNDELERLWKSLRMDRNIPVSCIIQLLCLTNCRKKEILSLKWSNIDYKNGYISIVKDRSKNNRPHFVKITPLIHEILRNVPQDGEYLFTSPSNREGFIQNIRKPYDRIKERAGVNPECTIHDIRRSITTFLKSKGHDDMSIAAACNHKSVSTTRAHYIQIERKKMAEIISDISDKFSLVDAGYTDPLFLQSSSPS